MIFAEVEKPEKRREFLSMPNANKDSIDEFASQLFEGKKLEKKTSSNSYSSPNRLLVKERAPQKKKRGHERRCSMFAVETG